MLSLTPKTRPLLIGLYVALLVTNLALGYVALFGDVSAHVRSGLGVVILLLAYAGINVMRRLGWVKPNRR